MAGCGKNRVISLSQTTFVVPFLAAASVLPAPLSSPHITTGSSTEKPTPPLICAILFQHTYVYQVHGSRYGRLRFPWGTPKKMVPAWRLHKTSRISGRPWRWGARQGRLFQAQTGHRWNSWVAKKRKAGDCWLRKAMGLRILRCKEENRDYRCGQKWILDKEFNLMGWYS